MTRNNMLFLLVGGLLIAVGVLGYSLYQAKKEPKGVQINVGPGGLSIEKK
jgi:predicted negative regulator of RcsB-dependent stress response